VKVLEAAGRVIAERGADATRFADVAAESGVFYDDAERSVGRAGKSDRGFDQLLQQRLQ